VGKEDGYRAVNFNLSEFCVRIAPMTSSEFEVSPYNRLILAYAAGQTRPLFEAVFALDQQLGKIIRETSEPLLGQMRLRWWHDVILQAPDARPVGNPVLQQMSALDGWGAASQSLAAMVEGWEILLGEQDLTPEMVGEYARLRGATMFGFISRQSNQADHVALEKLGEIYVLWDLARHCTDRKLVGYLKERIGEDLDWLKALKVPRDLRPMSIFRHIIRLDIIRNQLDLPLLRPAIAARIVYHGLSGR